MPRRDYQQEYIENVGRARAEGATLMAAVSPTGTGKAEMLSNLPSADALDLKPGQQLMTMVHKVELCDQLAEKFRKNNPKLKVGIERERYTADANCDIVVASVQTIGMAEGSNPEDDFSRRLRMFDPDRVRHVVIDEAHHASKPGSSYHRVLRYLNLLKGSPKLDRTKTLNCFTATPNRADNIGLETIVDQLVFQRDVLTMMKAGMRINGELKTWLCDLKPYRVATMANLDEVGSRDGELINKQLATAVNTPERNSLAVDKYRELGEGQQFFAFTVDVQHSVDLAAAFQEKGIRAFPISGKTPMQERRDLIAAFRAKQIDGLISCGVLSEGVDIPSVSCLLMLRPSKSGLLYRQQIGRGFRPYPAPEELYMHWRRGTRAPWVKPYCIVIDFVDVTSRHQVNTVSTIFGLSPKFDMKGKGALETVEEIETIKAKSPAVNLSLFGDLAAVKSEAEKIDLFAKPTIPEEILKFSKLSWTSGLATGSYDLCLPDKGILTIRQNTLGEFEVYSSTSGIRRTLETAPDLESALRAADKSVPREALVVLQSDARWRALEVSEKQVRKLAELYPDMRRPFASTQEFANMVTRTYTRGDVSALISQKMGRAA